MIDRTSSPRQLARSASPFRVTDPAVHPSEPQEHRGQRRLAGPARPDDRHPAPGRQQQVDAAAAPAPSRRGTPPRPIAPRGRTAGRQRQRRRGRRSGSPTGGAASSTSKTRPAACRTRCKVWVATGRPDDQLEGGQRDQGDDRQLGRRHPAGLDRRDAGHQAAPAGQPGQQGRQAEPDPGGPGRRRGDGRQLGVPFADRAGPGRRPHRRRPARPRRRSGRRPPTPGRRARRRTGTPGAGPERRSATARRWRPAAGPRPGSPRRRAASTT